MINLEENSILLEEYSFNKNLLYIAYVYYRPKFLMKEFQKHKKLFYGIITFLICITLSIISWITVYFFGNYQAINPLPKFLPIPDDYYILFQGIFGPFIKAFCILIFYYFTKLSAYLLKQQRLSIKPILNFYLIIGNSLAISAIFIDQIISWVTLNPVIRFTLSTIHPIVVIIGIIYITMFTKQYANCSLKNAALMVIPALIISGPLIGSIFR